MSYEIVNKWLPNGSYPLKSPYTMTPAGIVVHNTAGTASAANEAAAMIGNGSAVGFHVVIDESQAVQCIPFSRNAWHAGDGSTGYANRNLIGIEIARSTDYTSDKYEKAEENAVEYIAHVCIQYGWTSENLHQHCWYGLTECPHRLKFHWDTFKKQVDAKINELKKGTATTGTEDDWMAKLTDNEINFIKTLYANSQKDSCSDWAKSEMADAIEQGITDGSQPQAPATREQVACMVLRALK